MKSEARIQQEIVMFFNNEYPELRGCLCYNNNNSVGGLRGKLNKFLGVVKGRSDMVLYYKSFSVMIELKTEKGRQSDSQRAWQYLMKQQGFEYYIIRSLDEFKELITKIII
tara:strand:+ start:770 stop:1102 length:333 start_codon:yes stop_codon:yes gene_type:complete